MSQSMMRRRVLVSRAEMPGVSRSRSSIRPIWGLLEPRIRCDRVVDKHLGKQWRGEAVRHGPVALELPVRIVGREQEHLVGVYHFDDAHDSLGIWRIERLGGEPYVLAHDLGRGALDIGHLGPHSAPRLNGTPNEARQPRHTTLD